MVSHTSVQLSELALTFGFRSTGAQTSYGRELELKKAIVSHEATLLQ